MTSSKKTIYSLVYDAKDDQTRLFQPIVSRKEQAKWFASLLWRGRFALASALVPLIIRSIPELIAGPYPIGYDTIGSYVPFMYDWSLGNYQSFNPFIGGWV